MSDPASDETSANPPKPGHDSPDVPGDKKRDDCDHEPAYEDRIRQFRSHRTGRYIRNPGRAA